MFAAVKALALLVGVFQVNCTLYMLCPHGETVCARNLPGFLNLGM